MPTATNDQNLRQVNLHDHLTTPYWLSAMTITCVVAIFVVAAIRIYSPDFTADIREDEFITLQDYTWAGINADASRRELHRIQDVNSLEPPTFNQIAMGIYASTGRWQEPNNHIPHSLMVNFSLLVFENPIDAIRFPALLAAVMFSLTLMYACHLCGWTQSAPLIGFCTFTHPYLHEFSATSRGYALAMFLAVLLLVLMLRVGDRVGSIKWSFIMVATSSALFLTLLNMSIDWVIPVYVAAWLFPAKITARPIDDVRQRQQLRKTILIQFLCIATFGGVFLLDRLPAIASSAMQYGVPCSSLSELFRTLAGNLFALFPGPLCLWLIVGVVGLCIAMYQPRGRSVIILCAAVMLFSVVHFVISMRLPYERGLGYLMIPVFLGSACAIEFLISRLAVRIVPRTVVMLSLVVSIVSIAYASASYDRKNDRYNNRPIVEEMKRATRPGENVAVICGKGLATVHLYLPPGWVNLRSEVPKLQSSYVVHFAERNQHRAEETEPLFKIRTSRGYFVSNALHDPSTSAIDGSRHVADSTKDNQATASTKKKSVFFYSPSYDAVAITWENVAQHFDRFRPQYVTSRHQVKLDVFGRLQTVVIFADGEDASVGQAIQEGLRRFGGQSMQFVEADGPG